MPTVANFATLIFSLQIKEEPIVWDKIEQFLILLPEPFTDPNKHERSVCYVLILSTKHTHNRLERGHIDVGKISLDAKYNGINQSVILFPMLHQGNAVQNNCMVVNVSHNE